MSVVPIRFPGPEKEPPFDVPALRKIISDLLVQTADEVESEHIEIKSWCSSDRELAEKVAEACACIANTAGGLVIVGVQDGYSGRKFSACPHSAVNVGWLQTNVHNLTRPPVECVPYNASDVLGEIIGSTDCNLYAIRVPRTRYISGHLTHKGISKIRVGKQCQPQYLAEDDRTSVTVPQVSPDDLAAGSIDWGIAQHQRHFRTSATWADRSEFLAQARL